MGDVSIMGHVLDLFALEYYGAVREYFWFYFPLEMKQWHCRWSVQKKKYTTSRKARREFVCFLLSDFHIPHSEFEIKFYFISTLSPLCVLCACGEKN
jgi:hypothetical protein